MKTVVVTGGTVRLGKAIAALFTGDTEAIRTIGYYTPKKLIDSCLSAFCRCHDGMYHSGGWWAKYGE